MKRKILRFLNSFWCSFCKCLPLKNRVLFYTIRGNGALDDNLKAVYDKYKGKKIIFASPLPHSKLQNAISYYKILTNKVIITDDYCRYLTAVTLRKKQSFIQIWHAAGAFKMFGLDDQNSIFTPKEERKYHSQYSAVCISADSVKKYYASAFGIDEARCITTGMPRTDILLQNKIKLKKKVYQKLNLPENKKIYLYCPTFREKDGEKTDFYPEIDFDELSNELKNDEVLIIHRHPVMKNNFLNRNYDNIFDLTDYSSNELLTASECLVTDYSSIMFDAVLLDIPCVFYCPDIERYERGFYLHFPDDLPGETVTNSNEILQKIRSAKINQNRAQIFKYNQLNACDGKATDRVIKIIEETIKK